MSSIVINGDTSGSVTLQAPAIAGSTVVTLPTVSMNIGTGGGSVATNTAFGASALNANTTGNQNTAVGYQAGLANTTGVLNTFIGEGAGKTSTTTSNITAIGADALSANTSDQNTAVGSQALVTNTTGSNNVAVGFYALRFNTTGSNNVGIGDYALTANTTSNNTAVGYQAGYSNTTGSPNVFVGFQAGYSNTTSASNTFMGDVAGYSTTGAANTFLGRGAGYFVTSGANNTILGRYNGNQGSLDIRTASNYIVLSDGDGNPRLYFDNNGVCRMENAAGGSGALRVRNTNNVSGDASIIALLGSNTQNTSSYFFVGSTPGVSDKIYIYGNGNIQNSNNSYGGISDAKLKENIVDASPKLADLMQVRVRNYNLKTDPTHKQLGVVAQELETVFPALVDESPDRDEEGNTLETTTKSVKYSVFVPMLIKAIQEQQALITSLTTRITALEAQVGA